MAYTPPTESQSSRDRREEREARAEALGCTTDEVYLQEQLERLRDEVLSLEESARIARIEAELQSKRQFLELCAAHHMDFTLRERAGVETARAYLETILASPLESFLSADSAFFSALRASCPLRDPF